MMGSQHCEIAHIAPSLRSYSGLCGWVQHAEKLATLERREADLKAQHSALANDAQDFKNKEGSSSTFVAFLFWSAYSCSNTAKGTACSELQAISSLDRQ